MLYCCSVSLAFSPNSLDAAALAARTYPLTSMTKEDSVEESMSALDVSSNATYDVGRAGFFSIAMNSCLGLSTGVLLQVKTLGNPIMRVNDKQEKRAEGRWTTRE